MIEAFACIWVVTGWASTAYALGHNDKGDSPVGVFMGTLFGGLLGILMIGVAVDEYKRSKENESSNSI